MSAAPAQAPLVALSDAPQEQQEQVRLPRTQDAAAQIQAPAPAPAHAQATVIVAGRSYPVLLEADTTVLGAMRELSSSGALSFSGKEFPSLGFFVESINGVKNAKGAYWMLYQNGVQSRVGASSTAIRPGDVIEWKYE